ncbi:MAG: hypothetical protein NTU63_01160 [Candidatus Pacearchaeota archaeon]|nr:hypothetical protein [Candidatus Pacearchaeota archaeon]
MDSLSDMLNSIDQSTVILFVVFIVAFAVLFFALLKFFKQNRAIAGIIAVALSFLIVYGMSKMDLSLEGFFSEIGISGELLSVILPIIGIFVAILIIINLAKNSLLVFGVLLIFLSFFAYEDQIVLIVIGCILIFVRYLIPKGKWEMKKKSDKRIWGGDRE